jgi:integrase
MQRFWHAQAGFALHDLRPTAVTMSEVPRIPLRDAQTILGHASISVTLGVYSEVNGSHRPPLLRDLLVNDEVLPNLVRRVLGHERSTTTLDLYTRRTDGRSRILDALNDPDGTTEDEDPPAIRSPSVLQSEQMLRGCSSDRPGHDRGSWPNLLADPLTRPSSGRRCWD